MNDAATAPSRVYRGDAVSLERLEANRRLLVLTAVSMARHGTSIGKLESNLAIMPRSAIIGSLKMLEQRGLVTSRLEPSRTDEGVQMRRYNLAPGVEINFDI